MLELDFKAMAKDVDDYAQNWTAAWFERIIQSKDPKTVLDAMEALGQEQLQAFWRQNTAIAEPLRQLLSDVDRGGRVNQQLQRLNDLVAEMQPPKAPGFWRRWLNQLLDRPHAPAQWASEFANLRQQLQALLAQLSASQQLLQRDRSILESDHQALVQAAAPVALMSPLFKAMIDWLASNPRVTQGRDLFPDDWVLEQAVPTAQKQRLHWQQQTTVSQQAILTLDMVLNQNQSLIEQIKQAIHMSTTILDVTTNAHWVKERGGQMADLSQQVASAWQHWVDAQREHQDTLEQATSDQAAKQLAANQGATKKEVNDRITGSSIES